MPQIQLSTAPHPHPPPHTPPPPPPTPPHPHPPPPPPTPTPTTPTHPTTPPSENHTYWGLKNNWGMQSKNGLQNCEGRSCSSFSVKELDVIVREHYFPCTRHSHQMLLIPPSQHSHVTYWLKTGSNAENVVYWNPGSPQGDNPFVDSGLSPGASWRAQCRFWGPCYCKTLGNFLVCGKEI